MGHIVLTVLGMVAQMERRFILERQRKGIARAKVGGIYKGGKKRLDDDRILSLSASGQTPTEIARQLGCSRLQPASEIVAELLAEARTIATQVCNLVQT